MAAACVPFLVSACYFVGKTLWLHSPGRSSFSAWILFENCEGGDGEPRGRERGERGEGKGGEARGAKGSEVDARGAKGGRWKRRRGEGSEGSGGHHVLGLIVATYLG